MGAVEAGSELGADASGQLGSTETFYGVLGHLPLPLWCDGRRVHKRYPVDYLEMRQSEVTLSEVTTLFEIGWNSFDSDLLDLLPEESCDGGSWSKGDLYMIGSI